MRELERYGNPMDRKGIYLLVIELESAREEIEGVVGRRTHMKRLTNH